MNKVFKSAKKLHRVNVFIPPNPTPTAHLLQLHVLYILLPLVACAHNTCKLMSFSVAWLTAYTHQGHENTHLA